MSDAAYADQQIRGLTRQIVGLLLFAMPTLALVTLVLSLIHHGVWSLWLTPLACVLTLVLCATLLALLRRYKFRQEPRDPLELPPTTKPATIALTCFTAVVYLVGLAILLWSLVTASRGHGHGLERRHVVPVMEAVMITVDFVLLVTLAVKCLQQRHLFERNVLTWHQLEASSKI